MHSTKSKEFDTIVLTKESYGFPVGTLGIHGGLLIDSGHYMIEFVVMDEDYHSYMTKYGHKTIQDYIQYQERENTFFGSQYWKNPFYVIRVYPEYVMSVEDVNRLKSQYQEEQKKLNDKMQRMDEIALLFSSK